MKRNSTIVSVAAATGIVGATVIAAISLMQATITNGAESDTVTLAATSATTPVPSDLVFTPEPLPEIPVISDSAAPSPGKSQGSKPKTSSQSAKQIDRDYAIKAVVDATGGTVTGVETMTYKSVDAFAVTVKRTDGSVITGYVDRSSGDIYEWAVVKAAPAVAPVQQYQDDDEDDDDHDASYAGDEDHDDEEDDRDNDDD
jgi:hypothetical protein